MKKILAPFLIIFFSFIIGYFGHFFILSVSNGSEKIDIKIGEKNYQLEVAKTSEQLQKGLAKFDKIENNQGMLFIFDTPGRWSIWMKDMKFNIDIIFLDENKKVVTIFENVKFETHQNVYQYRKYQPDYDSKYVIELKEGEIKNNKIKLGDTINF